MYNTIKKQYFGSLIHPKASNSSFKKIKAVQNTISVESSEPFSNKKTPNEFRKNQNNKDNVLSDSFKQLFVDYQKAFKSVSIQDEVAEFVTEIEGEIPIGLTGTLLRNGPALFSRNGNEKVFLDGDGMVASIALKDGQAFFRNKFIRTEGFVKEEEAGKYTELTIFTAEDHRPEVLKKPVWKIRLFDDIINGPPKPKNNGAYNAWVWANTLVAVDYGRPFQLDKKDLRTIERNNEFSKMNYTAHCRIVEEKDGSKRLCAFNPIVDWSKYKTTITFIEFDESGNCLFTKEFSFKAAYFHDLIVTDNWYILLDCPIKMDFFKAFVKYPLGEVGLGDTISEDTDAKPIFRLFPRRNDGPMVEVTCIDKFFYAFHHVNGFDIDEEGKKVIFDTCTWDRFTLYFQDIVKPDGINNYPRTKLTRFYLDLDTKTATSKTINSRPCEYPTVATSITGKKYLHSYMGGSAIEENSVNGPLQALTKVTYDEETMETGNETTWIPSGKKFMGEPIFVPSPNSQSEDDGWILVLVHDCENIGTELAILDAQDITKGPIANLRLPTYVPMGVHGSWSPDYILGPNN